jgi:hypothetical protein
MYTGTFLVGAVVFVVLLQTGISLQLAWWGGRVSLRRGGDFWRWTARIPVVALVLSGGGGAGVVLFLARTFASAAREDTIARANTLSQGLAEGLNCLTLVFVPAVVLSGTSAVLFLVGSLSKRGRGDPP